MPPVVVIDFETRSELNLNKQVKTIPASSVYDYARHPSTEVLCLGWCVDSGPVDVWKGRLGNDFESPLLGTAKAPGHPIDLLRPLFDAITNGARVVAHNANFERNIWEGHCVPALGWPAIPHEHWYCTAALSAHYGLPRGLDAAAEALGIEGKLDSGAMLKLSRPTDAWRKGKPGAIKWAGSPEDFADLAKYCRQDVEVTRSLFAKLPSMSEFERQVWLCDQEINQRGIPVDSALVEACCSFSDELQADVLKSLPEVSGGKVKTPGQIDKIKAFCKAHGVDLPNLQELTVTETLGRHLLPPIVREVLNLRVDGGGAALAKFYALRARTSPDGRVRGSYKYYGGHLGRWSAEGVQPQNMAKPEKVCDEPLIECLISEAKQGNISVAELWGLSKRQTLTALQRPCFRAPEGKTFVALDYAAIEARVTAWLADCQTMLQQFASGEDLYIAMATEIDARDPDRTLGKATVLGCGFGMGADTFRKNAKEKFGIIVSESTAIRCIAAFRKKYPEICALWYDLDKAFSGAIRSPDSEKTVGRLRVRYSSNRDVLFVRLPSSRCIFYQHPTISGGRVSYASTDGTTAAGWGGTWTENVVQAVAADVQRYSIWSLAKYLPQAPVIMHSHDEVVTECDESIAENIYNQQRAIMLAQESWSDGLPLDAKGWVGPWYRKD